MRKEKIMKSMSFKSREDMIQCLSSLKDKCGMDELVEKFEALDYLVGSNAEEESNYWEMKAEVHFGI